MTKFNKNDIVYIHTIANEEDTNLHNVTKDYIGKPLCFHHYISDKQPEFEGDCYVDYNGQYLTIPPNYLTDIPPITKETNFKFIHETEIQYVTINGEKGILIKEE